MDTNKIVQSLWIGNRLSAMEQLSINSFLKNGHEYHLYVYPDRDGNINISGIPVGVRVKNANCIIPEEEVFLVRGGYSSFSDFFRWKLIRDRGGWWVDTDAVCLKPLDFPDEYVFIGGLGERGSDNCITSGLFKLPENSPIACWAWEKCKEMNPTTMAWGEAGPPLITDAVKYWGFKSWKYIIPGKLFFPVFWTDAPRAFIEPNGNIDYGDAYSVHFFNELWRLADVDKDSTYLETSAYEQLKKRYL